MNGKDVPYKTRGKREEPYLSSQKHEIKMVQYIVGVVKKPGHWIAVVIHNPKRTIYLVDSMSERNLMANLYMRNWRHYATHMGISEEDPDPDWSLANPPHQLQNDNQSCGIFAWTYIKRLINSDDLKTIELDDMRREIAVCIISILGKTLCFLL